MNRIFSGSNGYYVAYQGTDGFHRQPVDNGAAMGWDRKRAEAALRAANGDIPAHCEVNEYDCLCAVYGERCPMHDR